MDNIQYIIDSGFCTGCCECISACKYNNISFVFNKRFGHPVPCVDQNCKHCGACVHICKKVLGTLIVS